MRTAHALLLLVGAAAQPTSDQLKCVIGPGRPCNVASLPIGKSVALVPGDGSARCIFSESISGKYQFEVIRGDSDKLHIHFQGGGACWDRTSTRMAMCSHIAWPHGSTAATKANGIFARGYAANPWREYTLVHVLYCSGDLHAGNVTRPYCDRTGSPVAQVGALNTRAVLRWIAAQQASSELAPTLSRLVLSGESAGSLGVQVWADAILSSVRHVAAAVVPDSYVGVFPLKAPRSRRDRGRAHSPHEPARRARALTRPRPSPRRCRAPPSQNSGYARPASSIASGSARHAPPGSSHCMRSPRPRPKPTRARPSPLSSPRLTRCSGRTIGRSQPTSSANFSAISRPAPIPSGARSVTLTPPRSRHVALPGLVQPAAVTHSGASSRRRSSTRTRTPSSACTTRYQTTSTSSCRRVAYLGHISGCISRAHLGAISRCVSAGAGCAVAIAHVPRRADDVRCGPFVGIRARAGGRDARALAWTAAARRGRRSQSVDALLWSPAG